MNSELWNKFVVAHASPSSFLQSWEWGEFQRALGNQIHRLNIKYSLQALAIVKQLPLGKTYLEVPKGPILYELGIRHQELWNEFQGQIREIAEEEQAVFVRINPPYEVELPKKFQKPKILLRQMEPERTILVDLTKSADEIMFNMHEKSRYNIRLAERKGVKVRKATGDEAAFRRFLELLCETTKRDRIVSWSDERFWKFRDTFMQRNEDSSIPRAELFAGELNGKILAAAIIMLFGDSGTYLYAASSGEDRNANVPSLVLWEAIREAKRQGMKWYDMWGVSPADDPNHPWAGITRFKSRYVKLGVTGKEVINVGTRDFVIDSTLYTLFRAGKLVLDLFPKLL